LLRDWGFRKAESWCDEVTVEWRKLHVQKLKTKVKFILGRPWRPREGIEVHSIISLTSLLDGVGGQRHAPAALYPGMTRYPSYRRMGGPQCPGKISIRSSTAMFVIQCYMFQFKETLSEIILQNFKKNVSYLAIWIFV